LRPSLQSFGTITNRDKFFVMRTILESDPNWFTEDEYAEDSNGFRYCIVCGCCPLEYAEVVKGYISLFEWAEKYNPYDVIEKRLVCSGGCTRNEKHSRVI
jgi:hypothetical protein